MDDQLSQWRRLSPIACIYYFFSNLKALSAHAMQTLAPLAVVVFSSEHKITAITLTIIGLFLLLSISAFVQYMFFRYRILPNEIQINQGVFKREHRVIQFERIQNTHIKRPIYFKPFNLIIMAIETAGGKGEEASLAGIGYEGAKELRDQILQQQQAEQPLSQDAAQAAPIPTEQPICSASLSDLVRYGLSTNGALVFIALLSPFINQLFNQERNGINTTQIQNHVQNISGEIAAPLILMIAFILILVIIGMLFSVLMAIIKFYGFTLTLKDNNLKCHSGLINKYEASLNLNKLQAISYKTNIFGQMFNIENLICHQTTDSSNKQQSNSHFIIPARPQAQSKQLSQTLFEHLPQTIQYQRISTRFIFKTFMLYALIPCLLLALIPLKEQNYTHGILIALLMFLALAPIYQRWKRYGYFLGSQYAAIQKGFIGYQRTIIPLFKVQRVEILQSVTQRRHNLSSLQLYLASGSYKIPYIPIQEAQLWFDRINYNIQSDPRPWF